jgi:hypothetical protein
MKQRLAILFLLFAFLVPGVAGAAEKDDFKVKTTDDFLELCIVPVDDPYHVAAVHFVHGYLVGAYHYYAAQAAGPNGNKFVCLPEKLPSRNEVVDMFVQWAKAHPQYMTETPVETVFRFLAEKWPCK